MLLAGTYYEDPYLLEMVDSDSYSRPSFFDLVFELLFRRAGLVKRPLKELPLSKYFAGLSKATVKSKLTKADSGYKTLIPKSRM